MSYIVISTSLNKNSKSALLAAETYKQFHAQKLDVEWLDLRQLELPHCDGDSAYGHANVQKVKESLQKASCIVVAVPIYNYDCGSSAKNLLELTGKACWQDKTVAFLCAAGGKSSYMSIMGFANSLMLDFSAVSSFLASSMLMDPPLLTGRSLISKLAIVSRNLSRPASNLTR